MFSRTRVLTDYSIERSNFAPSPLPLAGEVEARSASGEGGAWMTESGV